MQKLQSDIENAKASHESKLVREFALSISKNLKIYPYMYIERRLFSSLHLQRLYTSPYPDLEKATLFNNYFHSVFSTSTYDLPPENSIPSQQYHSY